MRKSLITAGLVAVLTAGCAYKTPNLVRGMKAEDLTNRDTPYSMQELVYGAGNRTFVRSIPETQEAKGLENYLSLALVPVENSKEIVDISGRQVRVEGKDYVLKALGKRTVKILGIDGEFKDYFEEENGLNERKSKNIGFRIPTVKIAGKEFYKILPKESEEGQLPLYLIDTKSSEVILSRGREGNRIYIEGDVYQPTLAEIVDKHEPKPEKPVEIEGEIVK